MLYNRVYYKARFLADRGSAGMLGAATLPGKNRPIAPRKIKQRPTGFNTSVIEYKIWI
jgi:hypothetical protein